MQNLSKLDGSQNLQVLSGLWKEITYYDGRLNREAQFKTQDLDNVGYIDKHETLGQIPLVMSDSLALYDY